MKTLTLLLVLFTGSEVRANSDDAGVSFDLQSHIDQAVDNGQKKIVIPPGRYRVTPHQRQHLYLHDLEDVDI
ncbi:MAG TPA: hypothetical protein EYG03_18635, partial [Planctomycetes bacterium]|nr:hypothetical protein [Planctomycetota bacterium]